MFYVFFVLCFMFIFISIYLFLLCFLFYFMFYFNVLLRGGGCFHPPAVVAAGADEPEPFFLHHSENVATSAPENGTHG